MPDIGKHIVQRYGSSREFKSNKRRLAKLVKYALDDLRAGIAYSPGYKESE